ncbi:MAG: hypothetical protein JNM93_12755 [Bacteriovoracaceae bacterium]|nr:hypothetical protein [Bacteriovoracaceae bacterium]
MKHLFLGISLCYLAVACQELSNNTSQVKVFLREESHYLKLVNDSKNEANLNKDIYLANDDYPIELALYENKRFYYNLPNYGEGYGSWKYDQGKIQLEARTAHFPMHIDLVSVEEKGTGFAITFRDRFGPKVLKVDLANVKI